MRTIPSIQEIESWQAEFVTGKPHTRIAHENNRHHDTVKKYTRDDPKFMAKLPELRKKASRLYHKLAVEILQSIDKKVINKASLAQRITASAIATDKGLLLEGQPTEIVEDRQLIVKRIEEIKVQLGIKKEVKDAENDEYTFPQPQGE